MDLSGSRGYNLYKATDGFGVLKGTSFDELTSCGSSVACCGSSLLGNQIYQGTRSCWRRSSEFPWWLNTRLSEALGARMARQALLDRYWGQVPISLKLELLISFLHRWSLAVHWKLLHSNLCLFIHSHSNLFYICLFCNITTCTVILYPTSCRDLS